MRFYVKVSATNPKSLCSLEKIGPWLTSNIQVKEKTNNILLNVSFIVLEMLSECGKSKSSHLAFSAANLPEKITVYSTLVGLLNAKNYSCGEEVSINKISICSI